MKQLFSILILSFIPYYMQCQEFGSSSSRPFFNLKWTFSSLVNPNTPMILAGFEIWPGPKTNLQIEYGLPVFNEDHANKADRYYRKYKFGVRQHYFPNLNKTSFWRRHRRKSLLPDTRRNFVGFDLVYFPQSYIDLNGRLTSSNGATQFYSAALVYRDAVASTFLFGRQIPLKKGFFIELYLGFGMKWMSVEHVLSGTASTPPAGSASSFDLSFFDNSDGNKAIPILDAGIKIGLEVLHK